MVSGLRPDQGLFAFAFLALSSGEEGQDHSQRGQQHRGYAHRQQAVLARGRDVASVVDERRKARHIRCDHSDFAGISHTMTEGIRLCHLVDAAGRQTRDNRNLIIELLEVDA